MAFLRRNTANRETSPRPTSAEAGVGGDAAPATNGLNPALLEAATAGEGYFDLQAIPQSTPNFLYGLMAPSWAERNQLVKIDYALAADLASQLRDTPSYNEDQSGFEILVDRTVYTPNRTARLRKMIIDAINGLPDDRDERQSLFNRIVSGKFGHSVNLRPTAELVDSIYRHAFGWGPLEPLMEDQTVTEIMVDRHDGIFVERTLPTGAELAPVAEGFETALALQRFVERMVEQTRAKTINFDNPTVDMSLPDGSRVHATIPPVTRNPTITIRRKRAEFYSLDDLQSRNSFTKEMREFIHEANVAGVNLITFGPTGSGKTTLLTALLDDKEPMRRIVIIEDTAEINITIERHPNTVWQLTGEKRSMRDLVKDALRMRPDHLIVGETRDATAYDLIQAFNSGQAGSMSTLHARDATSALIRLTNLVRQAEAAPTEEPARRMVSEAIQLLVFAQRLSDGTRRIISVDEVLDLDSNFEFRVQNVFRLVQSGRDENTGKLKVRFIHNPEYVMAPGMAKLFADMGLDPDRWTGEKARAAGKHAIAEEI